MNRMKLVSVRLESEDLEALDQIVEKQTWRKRSDLIQYGVKLIIEADKKGQLPNIFGFNPIAGDVCDKFDFEYHCQRS